MLIEEIVSNKKMQRIYRFENNTGASIIKWKKNDNRDNEVAILKFDEDDVPHVLWDETVSFNGIRTGLTDQEARTLLEEIERWSKNVENN